MLNIPQKRQGGSVVLPALLPCRFRLTNSNPNSQRKTAYLPALRGAEVCLATGRMILEKNSKNFRMGGCLKNNWGDTLPRTWAPQPALSF